MRRLIVTVWIAAIALAAGALGGTLATSAELAATEARLSVCGEGWYQTMGALNGMLTRFEDVTFYEDGSYSGCAAGSPCAR